MRTIHAPPAASPDHRSGKHPSLGWLAATTVAALALLGSAAKAQAQPAPPSGYAIVDDLILPVSAGQFGPIPSFIHSSWLGAGAVVPYTFSSASLSSVSAANQQRILDAMAEWEAVSGIDFVPRTNETDYVVIKNATGNASHLGWIGGAQSLYISSWLNRYVICHLLAHTLGVNHEHMRSDRNTYVTIDWQNALSGQEANWALGNFLTLPASPYGPYDFLSIMHPGQYYFWNGNGPTIICDPGYTQFQSQIGNRTYMTVDDALEMRNLYGAPADPAITSISRTWAVAGSAGFTLTVTGTGFFRGSPTAAGIQGTRIQWDGIDLPVTYVSPTEVQAMVGMSLLAMPGCASIRAVNLYPGGGYSNAVGFPVGPWNSGGTWYGTQPSGDFGHSVAALGDVDGDGNDDVLMGEPDYDSSRGRAWCFSGSDGSLLWSLVGGTGYRLGDAVAAAGDVNGDGVTDVLVGAPGYQSDTGRCYVVDGGTGAIIRIHVGGNPGEKFGWSVANAGDVNGDGVPDHVIGIPGYGQAGRVRILSGAGSAVLRTINGTEAGENFGHAVAGGHDAGSDGIPDIVVGAPLNDGAGTSRGRVYIFSGSDGSLLTSGSGAADSDRLGFSVAMAPGGWFIAGAPGAPGTEGFVRAQRGIPTFPITILPLFHTFQGAAAGDQFGRSVAYAGDIDQDGVADFVVGAPQALHGTTEAGYVRVYSGKSGDLLYEVSGSPYQVGTGAAFGMAVAGAFNRNGDSFGDILVGAPFANHGPCNDVGRVLTPSPRFPPSQRKVMISEVAWGTPEGVELTNFDTDPVSLSGWKISWRDAGTTKTSSPLNVTLGPGETLVVTEALGVFAETPPGVQVLAALPALSTSSGDISVAIVNRLGLVVDEVRVSDTAGNHAQGSLGGLFRGLALRGTLSPASGASGAVERIFGLDSNSGRDWTEEAQTSMGLENRSSGPRGTDPIPMDTVRISELDHSPDLIEFVTTGSFPTDIGNWFVLCSGAQNQTHAIIRPWPTDYDVDPYGSFFVIGEGPPPAEMPAGTDYVDISALGQNIPWATNEFDCALYDSYGRLVDLVRTTGDDDQVVHNFPRAPSAWSDFGGAAGRVAPGISDPVVGRVSGADTNTGTDFRPYSVRTMGSPNPPAAIAGPTHGHHFDVRLNATPFGGGLTAIINAGASHAGQIYSFLFSVGHAGGQGPILGLGADALNNFVFIFGVAPFTGTLDARGSARFDFPSGSLPAGTAIDTLFILLDHTGALVLRTIVLEYDA